MHSSSSSATAAFAYAFLTGSRLGALGPEYESAGRKALESLNSFVSPGGEVAGVSGSTPLLPDLEAYNGIPTGSTTTWGQGIALLALGEGL